MDIKSFFAALWADWVARMSGTGSIFLLAVGVWLSIPRWLVFLVAGICFVVAAIRVWTAEHRRATKLQIALTEPSVWNGHARSFQSFVSFNVRATFGYPVGREELREWSLYTLSEVSRTQFALLVQQAGARMKVSRYVQQTHPQLLTIPEDFTRWCELAMLKLVPFERGPCGSSNGPDGPREFKSIARFDEVSMLLCQKIATAELCVSVPIDGQSHRNVGAS